MRPPQSALAAAHGISAIASAIARECNDAAGRYTSVVDQEKKQHGAGSADMLAVATKRTSTAVFLEAANATAYLEDAFRLLQSVALQLAVDAV